MANVSTWTAGTGFKHECGPHGYTCFGAYGPTATYATEQHSQRAKPDPKHSTEFKWLWEACANMYTHIYTYIHIYIYIYIYIRHRAPRHEVEC